MSICPEYEATLDDCQHLLHSQLTPLGWTYTELVTKHAKTARRSSMVRVVPKQDF